MISSKEVLADFQFVANRIASFTLVTKDNDIKGAKAQVSFEFDYNILQLDKSEKSNIGVLEFSAIIKAKVKKLVLFNLNLCMEGIFVGNPQKLSEDKFKEMIEINGVATLSQLSRAYIMSVSALSGINPPIKMPMINVFSLKEKKDEKGNQDKKL